MNLRSSLVGSFFTIVSKTFTTFVTCSATSFFLFRFLVGTNRFALDRSFSSLSSSSDSFSSKLSSRVFWKLEDALLLLDGSTAWSGWHESLLLINGNKAPNHFPKPLSSMNRVMPVFVWIVSATLLHVAGYCGTKNKFMHFNRLSFIRRLNWRRAYVELYDRARRKIRQRRI